MELGELARVGGEQKDHTKRDNGSILEEFGDLVQQLFLGQIDVSKQSHDLMARTIDLHSKLRGEKERDNSISDDEDQHIDNHGANLRKLDL